VNRKALCKFAGNIGDDGFKKSQRFFKGQDSSTARE
jgi:hypothetical protein